MEAFCFKCKVKREIKDPEATFTSAGGPGTRGVCPVCGTKMFKMGRSPAHEGLTPPEKTSRPKRKKAVKRSGKLVIVESPAKARTVGRILGKGYRVEASIGHVRDLLRSQLSVDVENDFTPKYRVPNEKRPVVKELKALASKAEEIYLATDLDREGEAIAWHLLEAAEIEPERARRVVFHEITKPAIEEAFAHPRSLNMDLVDAQQARRILDRLVGYSISPILWRKVRNRLSAGRVQSVALRIIVEREEEIDNFVPVEYWSIAAEFLPEGGEESYIAKLVRIDGEKFELPNEDHVRPILTDMETAAYAIGAIKRGTRRRKPPTPFITSTLQQQASRRFGFTARRTMALAQQLYEGVDLGEGETTGLITYMRTDSTNVSEVAQKEARDYILEKHGKEYVPEEPPKHKTSSKRAQEAHEAIRPTSALREPGMIKKYLNGNQYRLYQLIWQRFLASQMTAAVSETLSVEVKGKSDDHTYLLRVSGSRVIFPGFLAVYEEAKGISDKDENGDIAGIPIDAMAENQLQELLHLLPEQHFTQAPPRFSDATLVSALEKNGIGRPSTYAPTVATLRARGYIVREERRLIPTDTGKLVNTLVVEHFPDIVDLGFTAKMEADLDLVASGEQPWVEILREFYGPFAEQVERANIAMPEVKLEPEKVGRACPDCTHDLIVRWGRYGKFIGCSNYPECRYTEPWLEMIGVVCPDDGGDLAQRQTRKGRTFYGCANYPECEFTSWKRPLPTPCPNCAGTLVVANKQFAQCLKCEERFLLDELNPESAEEKTSPPESSQLA